MEEGQPLVSVCMPAYNAGRYIGDAISSVIAQTYSNWELIIINDGSGDETAARIQQFDDRRISAYSQKNKGQCHAANRAFELSKGSLIKFMDADDLLSTDFIRSQVAALDGTCTTIASAAWGRFYHNDLATLQVAGDTIKKEMAPIEWLALSMTDKQVMLQCALWLIPRTVLARSGLWNEQLSLINDFEFFIRVLLHASKVKYAEGAVLYYRSGSPGSLSATRSRRAAESALNSIDWGTKHMLAYENSPRIRKIAADSLQDFVYDFFPAYPDLVKKATLEIKALGGSSAVFRTGGYTKILVKLLGWKMAKKIKYFISR